MTWTIDLCRGRWGDKIGEVVGGSFTASILDLEAGQWEVSCPLSDAVGMTASNCDAVGSIIIRGPGRDGVARRLYDGFVGAPNGAELYNDGTGDRVRWSGFDVYGLLGERMMEPDPTQPPPWRVARYHVAGPASEAVTEAIAVQGGVQSRPGRPPIEGLTVVDMGGGWTAQWSAEPTETLADFVGRVARGAGLSVSTTMNRGGPSIRIQARRNLTGTVVLSVEADVVSWRRRKVPPSATQVTTLGEGERLDQQVSVVGSGSPHIEQTIAVTGDDSLPEIAKAALEAGRAQWYVQVELDPTVDVQFDYLIDYRVGDIVDVQIGGDRFPLPVTSVTFTSEGGVERITPTLGEASRDSLSRLLRRVRGLERRISRAAL